MIRIAIIGGVLLALLVTSGALGYRAGVDATLAHAAALDAAKRAAADTATAAWDAAAAQIERARLALGPAREAQDAATITALQDTGGGNDTLDAYWRALDDRLR